MKHSGTILAIIIAIALAGAQPAAAQEALMDPASLTEQAPEVCRIKFETSEGDFVIEMKREWAPLGADRFYNMVINDYFTEARFFRVAPGFVVQFGLHADPEVNRVWREATIKDEPVVGSNVKGAITFAKGGPNSRTTQVYINLKDNTQLDRMGFSPFGKVVEGMDVVERLFGGYGDAPPRGDGPNQGRIVMEGNEYLKKSFPDLDFIKKATVLPQEKTEEKAEE
jgi:peptidyl-prolyl cis-trans isomerase A (cyclophilin A)